MSRARSDGAQYVLNMCQIFSTRTLERPRERHFEYWNYWIFSTHREGVMNLKGVFSAFAHQSISKRRRRQVEIENRVIHASTSPKHIKNIKLLHLYALLPRRGNGWNFSAFNLDDLFDYLLSRAALKHISAIASHFPARSAAPSLLLIRFINKSAKRYSFLHFCSSFARSTENVIFISSRFNGQRKSVVKSILHTLHIDKSFECAFSSLSHSLSRNSINLRQFPLDADEESFHSFHGTAANTCASILFDLIGSSGLSDISNKITDKNALKIGGKQQRNEFLFI